VPKPPPLGSTRASLKKATLLFTLPKHEIRKMRLEDLSPAPYNPRSISKESMQGLSESLRRFGLVQPIVWNKRSKQIVGGHQRREALMDHGVEEADVLVVDLDDNEERALNITLNNPNIAGEFTADLEAMLTQIKLDAPDFYDATHLDRLMADIKLAFKETNDSEENIPAVGAAPHRVKTGDVMALAKHRLFCGDCSDLQAVHRALGKDVVNLVVTSPPYASQRKYDEDSGFKPIHPEQYVKWFDGVQNTLKSIMADDGSFFLNIKEHCDEGERDLYVKDLLIAHVRKWGWRWVDEFAWVHGGTPKDVVNRFKNGWEPIYQFTRNKKFKFRPDAVRHPSEDIPDWHGLQDAGHDGHERQSQKPGGVGGAQGPGLVRGGIFGGIDTEIQSGMAYPSNVLSVGKNRDALGHGAAYPVALPEFFIKAYSDVDDIVVDPFMGSGSTLMACENTGRSAFGIEISPLYCDVIIQRWETSTGKKATRLSKAK
jgi:DNA modification methylase